MRRIMSASRVLGVLTALLMVIMAPNRQRLDWRSPAPVMADSSCAVQAVRTIAPDTIRLCEAVDVTIRLSTTCRPQPLHVVFAITLHVTPDQIPRVPSFLRSAVRQLRLAENPHIKVAVVWFDDDGANLVLRLTNNEANVLRYIDAPLVAANGDCYTCAGNAAFDALRDGSDEADRTFAVFSVGKGAFGPDEISQFRQFDRRVKAAGGIMGVIIPIGPSPICHGQLDGFGTPGFTYCGQSSGPFVNMMRTLVKGSAGTQIEELTVFESLSSDLAADEDSAVPPLKWHADDRRGLMWRLTQPISDVITITYSAKSLLVGTHTISGTIRFTDALRTRTTSTPVPVPSGLITTTEKCDIPPTSTPRASETPVSTEQPVPSESPTSSATPARPATATSHFAFLPIAINERPCAQQQRADVVVVLDASTSMDQVDGSGRRKIDASRDAVRALLELLALGDGGQVALVTFNAEAHRLSGLTSDHAAVSRLLDEIRLQQQTCLVCGLQTALDELASARHEPTNLPVVLILTDGRSNPRPASEAVALAQTAHERGVAVFTIGLGDDLDDEALRAIASSAAQHYHAPDAATLGAIYERIAVSLPCPGSVYWPGP